MDSGFFAVTVGQSELIKLGLQVFERAELLVDRHDDAFEVVDFGLGWCFNYV